ncbi:MAG TPA: stage II sporulation protein M [Beijerinckiaceae bacterium]|nr:stage II sporulation protein M [Beijerinckiaceae bacterium]
MDPDKLVLARGMRDTRATLAAWNLNPWPVLGRWAGWSLLTAVGLLAAVYVVARTAQPDPTKLALPGVNVPARVGDLGHILLRNGLVLALHSMACVAGFIAGSAMPQQAAQRSGLSKVVHERAGTYAIVFVVAATAFSLATQAYVLGNSLSTLSEQFGMSPGLLLLGILPHAVPELTALFLPLAAWVVASRRGRWEELLAATVVTTAVAAPVLIASALVELYVSPQLIIELAGG